MAGKQVEAANARLAALRGVFMILLRELEQNKAVDRASFLKECRALLAAFDEEPKAIDASVFLRGLIDDLTPKLYDPRQRKSLRVLAGGKSPFRESKTPRSRPPLKPVPPSKHRP